MDATSNNTTQNECLVDVPVLSLIGQQSGILVNIVANIGLVFTAILGNVLILLSFVFESSLRTTANYFLLGLALTDLGVGLVVHPLYISVMLSVYHNSVPHCTILVVYSISVSFLAGVSIVSLHCNDWLGQMSSNSSAPAI